MSTIQEELVMTIQPKIISHLGINLYTNLHAVISELVSNGWDACAHKVEISIPETDIGPDYEITVKDDGSGMDFAELNKLYLQVGRDRRNQSDDEICDGTRKILGRKGIGKFAVFGVAKTVSIRTVKDGKVTEFEMNIDKIKAVLDDKYKPQILEKDASTEEPDGVTVKLRDLKRKKSINAQEVISGIAGRFLLFSEDFKVVLNEHEITIEDQKIQEIEFTWDVDTSIVHNPKWKISGKIWAKKGTIREEHNRGIAVFARGRLIQEPSFFGATSGKEFAYPHLSGQLTADFLDEKDDNTSTDRASINFESEEGLAFRDWAHQKLTEISVKWSDERVKKRTNLISENPEVKTWLKELTPTERKSAKSILNSIARNDNLSDEQALDLFGYVKDTFDYRAFQDLADQIEAHGPEDAPIIIDLFRQWEHLESREMYRILKGRISSIRKLREFIEKNSKEKEAQKYLRRFPWVLNPKWTIVEEEAPYSKLLSDYFKEDDIPEEDRRLDFLCFSSWGEFIVIELKRPGVPVGAKQIGQLTDYVLFIKEHLATSERFGDVPVYGYLICEKIQQSAKIATMIKDMKPSGRFVLRYTELASYAEKLHDEFLKKYEEIQLASKPKEDE